MITLDTGRAPRLLYVITDLEVGGVPLHLLRLAPAVRDAGYAVAVASLKSPGPVRDRLRHAGIDVLTCNAGGAFDWRLVDRLGRLISDFAPDLVHTLLFHANVAGRLVGALCGFPRDRLVCEIQTVEIERRWHLWGDRLTYRLCRCLVGNSPSVVDHLHARAKVPRERLRLVLGGVDVARYASADALPREALGVRANEKVLLWVGRMDPVKGLDTLVAAVDLVRRNWPVKLLLAGDGPERANVESGIARRGLGDCVRLLGRRDDVPRILKSADVFVLPSRTEGLPNAILEAMAGGVPVIATDVPGSRDLVTDGVTGLLTPVDDAHRLAVGIEKLLSNAVAARRMAENAREMVAREYTLERCHKRYLELYREVLADGRA